MALSWYIIYTDQLVFSLECQNFLKIIVSNEIMRNSDIFYENFSLSHQSHENMRKGGDRAK